MVTDALASPYACSIGVLPGNRSGRNDLIDWYRSVLPDHAENRKRGSQHDQTNNEQTLPLLLALYFLAPGLSFTYFFSAHKNSFLLCCAISFEPSALLNI
jgi:hypothetical protein